MHSWGTTPRDQTIVGTLLSAVEDAPNATLFDFSGSKVSFAEFWAMSAQIAGVLHEAGIRAGDTVITMLDNHADHVAAWFGANMLGAIWVGINTALRGEFLRHVVNDAGARVVICEPDFTDRFAAIEGDTPRLELLLVRGGSERRSIGSTVVDGLESRCADAPASPLHRASSSELAMLVYTGGTTGPSKGCMISNAYALNLCKHFMRSTGRTADEVNWSALPMYHFNIVAQTVLSSMVLRGTAAISKRFSVSGFWPDVERSGARIVNLLGAMGTLIAHMPDTPEMARCHGQIRFVSGAPFPPEIQQIWRQRYGTPEIGGGVYGLTEAVPLTVLSSGTPSPDGSSGKRNEEDFEVRIFGDHDIELPDGEVGEIVARPRRPDVMYKGYWGNADATLASLENMWFHTGDLGRFDEDGFFYFVDRKKDYLRRRGENISSVELETTFHLHPDIHQVAVHAVPSELTEDDVKVTAVLVEGATLSPLALFDWAKERVPYYALPRFIEFRSSLPVSAVGRVHKYQLRDEGAPPGTWDRETDAAAVWDRR